MKLFFWLRLPSFVAIIGLFVVLASSNFGSPLAFAGMPGESGEEAVEEQTFTAPEPSSEIVEEPQKVEKEDSPSIPGRFTIGARGSLGILSESDASSEPISFQGFDYGSFDGTTDFNEGYGLNFMLGYALSNGMRFEAEVGYLNSDLNYVDVNMPGTIVVNSGIDASGNPCHASSAGCIPYAQLPEAARDAIDQAALGKQDLDGNVSALTFMLNAYYDLDLGGNFVPYVGTGIGAAHLSAEIESGEGITKGDVLVDDEDYVLIYQVGAGMGYKVGDFGLGKDITLTFDYRYLASFDEAKFKGSVTGNFLESEYQGHYIGGGVRLGLQ